jgi:hypothetical protein
MEGGEAIVPQVEGQQRIDHRKSRAGDLLYLIVLQVKGVEGHGNRGHRLEEVVTEGETLDGHEARNGRDILKSIVRQVDVEKGGKSTKSSKSQSLQLVVRQVKKPEGPELFEHRP